MLLIEDVVLLSLVFVLIQVVYYMIDKWEHAEKTFRKHGFVDFSELDKVVENSKLRALFNYTINPILWILVQILTFVFVYLLSGYVYKIIFIKGDYKLFRFTDKNPFNQEFQN